MSRHYRAAVKLYEDYVKDRKGALRQRDDREIFEDPLFRHMMEGVAPRVWMTITLDRAVTKILDKTIGNIQKRKSDAARKIISTELPPLLSFKRLGLELGALVVHGIQKVNHALNPNISLVKTDFETTKRILNMGSELKDRARGEMKNFDNFARVPYPKLWLDLSLSDETTHECGVLIEENPTEHLQEEWLPMARTISSGDSLKEKMRKSLDPSNLSFRPRYRCIVFYAGRPVPYCINFFPLYNDIILPFNSMRRTMISDAKNGTSDLEICTKIADRVKIALMLMNTRNSPLESIRDADLELAKQGSPEEIKKFEDRLAVTNKPSRFMLKNRTLKFDLSRVLKKHPKMDTKKVIEFLQRHLVTGHFKLRKTGLWWWSPFLRGNQNDGQTEESIIAQAAQRGRIVTASRPISQLASPDGTVISKLDT